jgi:transposase
MGQIHKRFTSEQVTFLFRAYMQGNMKRTDVQKALGIGRSHFFDLLREYRRAPETFSIACERSTPPRPSLAAEAEIRRELLRERKLVEDPRLPISGYNLSGAR